MLFELPQNNKYPFFFGFKKQNTFRHLHLITPTGNLYFLEDYLIHNLLYTKLGYSI